MGRSTVIFAILFSIFLNGQGPVFPGAYGYGSNWDFPTSYTVRKVTNLNDSGAGSLRDAVSHSNSIVVFEVSGNIGLTSTLVISGNVYVAGQTSFRYGGGGINIHKATMTPTVLAASYSNNVIIRYLTFSGDPNEDSCCADTMLSTGDNFIMDHCTLRYGSDEIVDLSHNQNITVQYTVISYALAKLGYGGSPGESGRGFLGYSADNVTLLGNMFAENSLRNPSMAGDDNVSGHYEVVNNIIFNAISQGMNYRHFNEGNVNIYNNLVNRGRSTQTARSRYNYNTELLPASARLYASGNLDSYYRPTLSSATELSIWTDEPNSRRTGPLAAHRLVSTPFPYPLVSTYTPYPANQLRDSVMSHVGNSIVRDDIDLNLMVEFDNNNGITTYPAKVYAADLFAVPIPPRAAMSNIEADSDNDGIPDSEEATWGNDTFGYVNSLAGATEAGPDPIFDKRKISSFVGVN